MVFFYASIEIFFIFAADFMQNYLKEGTDSPLFYLKKMISESTIHTLVNEKIEGTDLFLVDLSVKPGNKIMVLIDAVRGLSIDDCVKISRHIEFSLDRESEDFDLQVSSPGADAPFKVRDQYKKYEGKNVEVITTENKVINGRIIASDETKFELEMKLASKGNKKIATTEIVQFNYNQIKQTKATISFK